MANQPETTTYDAGVYQIETGDAVVGGVGGIANRSLLNLANRTNWLKDQLSQLVAGTILPAWIAPLNSPGLTGTPTSPTPPVGDNTTKIATAAFVQETAHGLISVNVAGNSNVALTQAQWGLPIITLTGAVTGNINVIFPTQSGQWLVINSTTGGFAITCKTAAGSGIIVPPNGIKILFGDGTNIVSALQQDSRLSHGKCQLQYVNSTSLKLAPRDGCNIIINGAQFQIPSGGILAANTAVYVGGVAGQNLAASTDYLVFLFNNSGTLTFDFWPLATGHLTDTTAGNVGIEVRSNAGAADSTRTLIGMVGTDASSHFADADGSRLTLSWFSQISKTSRTTFTANRSSASTSWAEVNTEIRGSFLTWADQPVAWALSGEVEISTSNACAVGLGFDGTTPANGFTVPGVQTSGSGQVLAASGVAIPGQLSEGRHYGTLLATTTTGGTVAFWGADIVSGSTDQGRPWVLITVKG